MVYTIIDIETTGFSRENDDLLEVGYIQVNKNLEILRSGSLYFYKPEYKVESDAQRVHGLTRSFLSEHEGKFDDNIVSLFTLLQDSILIGKHSNAFDLPFLDKFFWRNAYALAPVTWRGVLDIEPHFKGRFRQWYQETTGQVTAKFGTLEELITMIGYTQDQIKAKFTELFPDEKRVRAHSALYDVFMTYLLLVYAVRNYGMEI